MFLSSVGIEPQKFHTTLANFNRSRTAIGTPSATWETVERESLNMRLQEGRFLEGLRSSIAPLASDAPQDPDQFIIWFESLSEWGPGQYHPLFNWLANRASADQLKWFLTQEAAGEAGFEDLVAYTQVKLPPQAKLECARNYWDEMGRGKYKAMHGPLLESMQVSLAMQRLDFPRRSRRYFDLHAKIDVLHSHEWNSEVIYSLVAMNPDCARFIAEGALMRLRCGELCFDRYSKELKLELLHNLNKRTLANETRYA